MYLLGQLLLIVSIVGHGKIVPSICFHNLPFHVSTPIFTSDGEGGSEFAAASAGGAGFDFGVDPNLDPELALALRVSMEEERARQEVAAKRSAEETSKQEKGGEQPSGAQDTTMNERASAECSDAQKTSDPMVGLS